MTLATYNAVSSARLVYVKAKVGTAKIKPQKNVAGAPSYKVYGMMFHAICGVIMTLLTKPTMAHVLKPRLVSCANPIRRI